MTACVLEFSGESSLTDEKNALSPSRASEYAIRNPLIFSLCLLGTTKHSRLKTGHRHGDVFD